MLWRKVAQGVGRESENSQGYFINEGGECCTGARRGPGEGLVPAVHLCQVNINFIVITAKAPGMLPVRWRLPSVLHVFTHLCSPQSCEVGTNFIPIVLETLVPAEQI